MLDQAIDRIEARLAPHAKAISIVAVIWFWLGVAVTARFIRLPDWPWLPDQVVFWSGVAINALWWGFLNPAIQRRRAVRETPEV